MRAAIRVLLSTLLMSCGSRSGTTPVASTPAAAAAADCTQRLAPRSVPRAAARPEPSTAAPPSRLVVHAKLSLAKLGTELERHIAPRLAEGTGIKLGPAGVLDYSVDRGAFSLSLAGDHLVVETPVYGRAQACRGGRCYAGCEPRALVRAEIPLWLGADYRFGRSRVSLDFTHGCKVRVFRGMLSVDVTPMLKSALAPPLERVRREIDRRLPNVRADLERGWRQLATPRPLPIGGCLVVEPLGLVQGPVHQSGATAHARFALLARPELRTDCGEPAPIAPLPPLSSDRALPDEDVVTLGMELPLTDLALAFESATPEGGSRPRYHVADATLEAVGQRVAAELELAGELCGALALQATPTFDGEAGVIELTAGEVDAVETQRVRAAGLDPAALARQLTRLPRLPVPITLAMLRAAPHAFAWLFSDPAFSVSPQVTAMHAAGATVRGEKLVAWVKAPGSLLLEQK